MIIYIEVKDLLVYIEQHSSVTGIQRIVSGFIINLFENADDHVAYSDVKFCWLDPLGSASVEVLSLTRLAEILKRILGGKQKSDSDIEEIRLLAVEARPTILGDGDVLFFIGAYWTTYDLFHLLGEFRAKSVKIGALIYDIIPITHPEWVPSEARKFVVDRAISIFARSSFFITISEFAERELSFVLKHEMGIAKPIKTVKLPHSLPKVEQAIAERRRKVNSITSGELPEFVLVVGTVEGRKNHKLLHHVWSKLIRRYGWSSTPYLFIVGKWGSHSSEFAEMCTGSNYLGGKLKIFTEVDDIELSSLYQGALFTVFPSFVEGWGMPIGESLSYGKVCVASNASSIPEVGGIHVEYYDPRDVTDAFEKINRFISDPSYRKRKEQEIRDDFSPRTWDVYCSELIDGISYLASSDQYEPEPPTLSLKSGLSVLGNFGLSTSVPWGNRMRYNMLSRGWGPVEGWGCWAYEPHATLSIVLPEEVSPNACIVLEGCFPPGCSNDIVVISTPVSAQKIIAKSNSPFICRVDLLPGQRQMEIELRRSGAFGYNEPDRTLFFGIRSIRIGETSQENFISGGGDLEEILLGSLVAHPE